jgi:diketogulonate reductase-like aldo/keto reductase
LKKTNKQYVYRLRELKTNYIDLLLIHWPMGKVLESGTDKVRQEPLHKLWAKLEGYVKAGKLRSIGVSNFNCQLLLDLLSYAEIKPAMNQIEIHPYYQQTELVKFCQRFNIQVTSYSPFAKGDGGVYTDGVHHVFNDKVLLDIAAKHKRTVGQVCFIFL